jgi:hypothetical protein
MDQTLQEQLVTNCYSVVRLPLEFGSFGDSNKWDFGPGSLEMDR